MASVSEWCLHCWVRHLAQWLIQFPGFSVLLQVLSVTAIAAEGLTGEDACMFPSGCWKQVKICRPQPLSLAADGAPSSLPSAHYHVSVSLGKLIHGSSWCEEARGTGAGKPGRPLACEHQSQKWRHTMFVIVC